MDEGVVFAVLGFVGVVVFFVIRRNERRLSFVIMKSQIFAAIPPRNSAIYPACDDIDP